MSSDKKIEIVENESDENLPFDFYDLDYPTKVIPSNNYNNSFMESKSAVRVASNSNGTYGTNALNEYDVDDEEDFISTFYYLILNINALKLNLVFKQIAIMKKI